MKLNTILPVHGDTYGVLKITDHWYNNNRIVDGPKRSCLYLDLDNIFTEKACCEKVSIKIWGFIFSL